MRDYDVSTFLVGFVPAFLFLTDVNSIIVLGVGIVSFSWIARQFYMSFKSSKIQAKQHQLLLNQAERDKDRRTEEKEKRAEEKEKHAAEMKERAAESVRKQREEERKEEQHKINMEERAEKHGRDMKERTEKHERDMKERTEKHERDMKERAEKHALEMAILRKRLAENNSSKEED